MRYKKKKDKNLEFISEEDGLSTYDLTLIASRIYSELTPVSERDYFEENDDLMAA
tara:strand:+ start:148 stop:312 length:165 start_codon:yes stop_codon:yes gene_type:complete